MFFSGIINISQRGQCLKGVIFMNFIEKIIYFLQATMDIPQAFSLWHIISLLAVVASCVLAGFFMRKASNKTLRIFLIVTSAVLVVCELLKQGVFSMGVHDGVATWDYAWYVFPFQFCSMPMYIGLVAGIIRPGKVQDCLLSFLSTFAILAGLIVMFVPSQVYCNWIFINIQTMIYHGAMLMVGTVILVGKHTKIELKTILKGAIIFAICMLTALIMDIVAVKAFNIQETFNMFFISPYQPCPMPVFSIFYAKLPYLVFLLLYLIGFVGGTFLVMYIIKFVSWLVSKMRRV